MHASSSVDYKEGNIVLNNMPIIKKDGKTIHLPYGKKGKVPTSDGYMMQKMKSPEVRKKLPNTLPMKKREVIPPHIQRRRQFMRSLA